MVKVKCVFYSCTNNNGDTRVIWTCVPANAENPPAPGPKCTFWYASEADSCKDCKERVGESGGNVLDMPEEPESPMSEPIVKKPIKWV